MHGFMGSIGFWLRAFIRLRRTVFVVRRCEVATEGRVEENGNSALAYFLDFNRGDAKK